MGFTKMRIFLYMELFLLVSAAAAVAAATEGEETTGNVGELGRRLLLLLPKGTVTVAKGAEEISKARSTADVEKFGSNGVHTEPGPGVESTAWQKNNGVKFQQGYKTGKKVYKLEKEYCDTCCDVNNQQSSCAQWMLNVCMEDDQSTCTSKCLICKDRKCAQQAVQDNDYNFYECNEAQTESSGLQTTGTSHLLALHLILAVLITL